MYLKRIEINGFKSFADKTEFVIHDGVTGIVGPNGSGKSNIADAIRWVLGEQSSKNLRGAKMEDVIFGGTLARNKKAFCEVSLVFDNQDGRLALDYSEIVITRKLYRSGESEYLLNQNSVRLKDIVDLMRDTGVGKEGYSIIGQGRIDEILLSKPAGRRKVFEEAAGIMKFRARKEEAEQKLARTQDNLTRVEDVLEELSSQLAPLEQQAEQTRKYLQLYERQRVLDANLFLYNHDRFTTRLQKLTDDLQALDLELQEVEREWGGLSEQSEQLSQELEAITGRSEELARRAAGLSEETERVTGQQNLVRERIANLQADVQRMQEEQQSNAQNMQRSAEEFDALEDKRIRLRNELEECDTELQTLTQEQQTMLGAADARRDAIQMQKNRYLELLDQISSRRSELARLSAETEGARQREDDVRARLKKNAAEKDARLRLIVREEEELQALLAQKTQISGSINESNTVLQALREKCAVADEAASQAKQALLDTQSRQKLLIDLKAEYEGYSDSVRNLMREGRRANLSMMGTFAELVGVPAEYELAIETVLGSALQNVVVQTERDAQKAIEFLRARKLGRVTFLPLQALKIGKLSEQERKYLTLPGVLTVASEAVQFSAEIAPAVEFLLARTVIVRDLDAGIRLMRAVGYSFRAVTLEGDILRPGGSMTGGSASKRQFGLLSRDRSIAVLSGQVARQQACLDEKTAALDMCRAELDAAKEASRELMATLKDAEIAAAEQRERIATYQTLLQGIAAAGQTLEIELRSIQEEAEGISERHRALEALIDQLEVSAEQTRQKQTELEQSDTIDVRALTDLNERINVQRIRRAEISKDCESVRERREHLAAEREQYACAVRQRESALQTCAVQMAALDEELEQLADAKRNCETQLEETRALYADNEQERARLRGAAQERQRGAAEYHTRRTVLIEQKFKQEGQRDRVQLALENAQNKLWDDYELTYAGAEAYREEMNYTAASRECEQVRGEIRALGVVNPNAIEDFERMHARAAELSEQKDDLTRAQSDLVIVIEQLLGKMRTTFEERFTLLNAHFKRIFSELFGGGNAELWFEEGDIMEAGIEISAQPPGKRLQHMSLLSGGERALTAIALLFAMISINPSPVCLLDEIDAPLDEANATRFANYLKNITQTQFLVITHRKPTMLACNALYGVAMQEKGVSRLVSVKLEDAAG